LSTGVGGGGGGAGIIGGAYGVEGGEKSPMGEDHKRVARVTPIMGNGPR